MIATIIICEIISTLLIVYGFMHKKELVQFEKRVRAALNRDLKTIKIGICIKCLNKEGFVVEKSEVA